MIVNNDHDIPTFYCPNKMMLSPIILLLLLASQTIFATTFLYPEKPGDQLIGESVKKVQWAVAKQEDTLLDIARTYDIGQNEILRTNPTIDRWLPGEGTAVAIPHSYLLPTTPHQGLTLNLPEYRLYYYPQQQSNQPRQVITYPISIGRVDWNTPLGQTRIIAKTKNPVWRPPPSIKQEHAQNGEILPDVFPAGEDNPLGLFALRLGIPGYLIHGTNKPYGVGMRVSHGCIRLYPEDIEALFLSVQVKTPVYIVNQPIKVGWSKNRLYIEIHPELEGEEASYEERLEHALDLIEIANQGELPVVRGTALREALIQANGRPVVVFEPIILNDIESED